MTRRNKKRKDLPTSVCPECGGEIIISAKCFKCPNPNCKTQLRIAKTSPKRKGVNPPPPVIKRRRGNHEVV